MAPINVVSATAPSDSFAEAGFDLSGTSWRNQISSTGLSPCASCTAFPGNTARTDSPISFGAAFSAVLSVKSAAMASAATRTAAARSGAAYAKLILNLVQRERATSAFRFGADVAENDARNALRLPAICQVQSRPLPEKDATSVKTGYAPSTFDSGG